MKYLREGSKSLSSRCMMSHHDFRGKHYKTELAASMDYRNGELKKKEDDAGFIVGQDDFCRCAVP